MNKEDKMTSSGSKTLTFSGTTGEMTQLNLAFQDATEFTRVGIHRNIFEVPFVCKGFS